MTLQLRIVLLATSILILLYILLKIRRSVLNIPDSIFWIVFAVLLLIFSIFPKIAYFFAGLLGIESPLNFLILIFIALILLKLFLITIRQSDLDEKMKKLAQQIAFDEFERRNKNE